MTETLEKARAAIEEHVDALRTERDGLENRRTELDRQIEEAVEAARRLGGNGSAPSPPPKKKPAAKRKASAGKAKAKKPAVSAPSAGLDESDELGRRVLAFIAEHGPCRNGEIREGVGIGYSGAETMKLKRRLRALIDTGKIEMQGQRAGARYVVASAEGKVEAAQEAAPEPTDDTNDQDHKRREATAAMGRRRDNSAPPKAADHAERAKSAGARSEEAGQVQERIIEYVRQNPGHSRSQVAEALGLEHVAGTLTSLVQRRRLRTENGGLFVGAGLAVTQPDAQGARTQQEREIVNELRERPGQRSTELADRLKRKPEELSGVLMALVRRRVLTCESGRYSVSSGGGQAHGQSPSGAGSAPSRDDVEGIGNDLEEAGLI